MENIKYKSTKKRSAREATKDEEHLEPTRKIQKVKIEAQDHLKKVGYLKIEQNMTPEQMLSSNIENEIDCQNLFQKETSENAN